jgi:hypothetical protein
LQPPPAKQPPLSQEPLAAQEQTHGQEEAALAKQPTLPQQPSAQEQTPLRVADICCGIGGVTEGLGEFSVATGVTVQVVLAVGGCDTTCSAYKKLHPQVEVL